MNDYGFNYLNYITNIPQKPNYNTKEIQYPNQIMINNTILPPKEGFIKGNLFNNLYNEYKNYKPKEINATNERETLLYQIMQYKFTLIELNLYLDTNPNNRYALDLYNQYLTITKQMINKYETMYGPLTLNSTTTATTTWNWNNTPWPWEVK